jgi:phage terminase small subunit
MEMPAKMRKVFLEETEEELMKMSRADLVYDLSDKEIKFSELYVRNNNVKICAAKAGYSPRSAHIVGWKVRQKPDVNRYITWLKLQACKRAGVTAMEVMDHYARIAFADVTDFVEIKPNSIKLINPDLIDGQLIRCIKQGKEGISVEFYDKLDALEKLERYLDVMPKDWKQKIEEKKLEIQEKRLEIERMKAGFGDETTEDDGFINALKESAKEVWEDEEDESKDEE